MTVAAKRKRAYKKGKKPSRRASTPRPQIDDETKLPCPTCKAPAGKRCRKTASKAEEAARVGDVHRARWRAAEADPERAKSKYACSDCHHPDCPGPGECVSCPRCLDARLAAPPPIAIVAPSNAAPSGNRTAPAVTSGPAGAVEHVLHSKIRRDGGTQPRASIDQATVETYADDYRALAQLPPLVVFFDGQEYWLADGFHRFEALILIGRMVLECEVRQGSRRDAILYSVGANARHGLRRSSADKRRAIETLLRDEEWGAHADRWIAERAAVDHKTVGRVRAELRSAGEIPHLTERQGQDGKIYPASQASRTPASSTTVDYDGEGHPDESEDWIGRTSDRSGSPPAAAADPGPNPDPSSGSARRVAEDLHDASREASELPDGSQIDPGGSQVDPAPPTKRTWRGTLGLPERGALRPAEVVAAYERLAPLAASPEETEALQLAKAHGLSQWYTRPTLARRMAELSNIASLARMRIALGRHVRVLEPSAGAGALCTAVAEAARMLGVHPAVHITAHEVDPRRAALLRQSLDVDRVIEGDFLASPRPEDRYDLAIANTPSERGLDGLFLEEMMARADRVVALLRVNALCGQDRNERVWSQVAAGAWHLLALRVISERPDFLVGSDTAAGHQESADGAQSDYCVVYLARAPDQPVEGLELTSVAWWAGDE